MSTLVTAMFLEADITQAGVYFSCSVNRWQHVNIVYNTGYTICLIYRPLKVAIA